MRSSTIRAEDLRGVFDVPPLARTSDEPRLSLRLHELAAAGDHHELERLMRNCVIPLYAIRGRRKGYEVSTMKALMDVSGLRGGPVRPPLVNVSDEEWEELREILAGWKPFLD